MRICIVCTLAPNTKLPLITPARVQPLQHTQRRLQAGDTAHRPVAGILEDLELRQSMCKVFSGS